ncbi:long-chain-fatty-acid--CoA ligase [Halolamina pelagica]|uniref:Long-chain-fatty-acid--CoA ligase n=1 Tax=Halolamina pelagica TaxID=699431 RepID=A0A0P7FRV3_9EURY|nr:long-chain-fatty-acid--CoA ligase [Halolamina pelagica]KPN32344.1 long-chain-fatty-acid--CoA ligase [Halolamina pelagica]
MIFVDPSLAEKLAAAYDPEAFESVEQFVVMGSEVPDLPLEPITDYESFIGDQSTSYEFPELDEEQPAGMCYTSGTTGMPKGVEYTHKMLHAHTMATMVPQALNIDDADVVMPVVPMFHVNAWGCRSRRPPPGPSRCSPARRRSRRTSPGSSRRRA